MLSINCVMDGLASLAAAATIIGDYGEKSNSKSPNKRKVMDY